ncbi:transketolase [Nitrincola sp. A-D6]|uniref:transketolase n=1 Tax=Nitrincola sp. A-D6 TaxID=1545442 RepID=UPI00051FB90E|nr:transketolase [Nitrincola sp. A-D6]KGK41787.1 transketolase [Nitrincola sp. A-D6]
MTTRTIRANALRMLAVDAVQKAKSGHPGAPMGMADIAEVLWNDYLRHNPENPYWPDRDRFVLSNGHGSMLVYALLHLSGYDLSIDELQNFRQLHSKTPGHPEYGYTPGVETTTGPLGQGLANAVGMALAEKTLGAHFNQPEHRIVDHFTYTFLGDGCMMEGISHEVSSLAGTLKLGKLIAFYDDNGISIDGEVKGWFRDDTAQRFKAYGWQVIGPIDGHDPEQIRQSIETARAQTEQPSLIICKTIIGFGSPNKSGKEECHGAPLGDDEVALTRERLDWPYVPFEIPDEISRDWNACQKGRQAEMEWKQKLTRYSAKYPELANEFKRRNLGVLPENFSKKADEYIRLQQTNGDAIASRKASQNFLDAMAPLVPELLGGSADLAPSNLTFWKGAKALTPDDAQGNYVHYGVREFGMTAIINGITLHGGLIAYGATFLIFMEYARNAMRMAALMKLRNIQVYTHDSIGLGEDGPTHQPIEQLTSLRTTPNMSVWRPADAVETAVAWKMALERSNGPTALILSRQTLAHQSRTDEQLSQIAYGGYVLYETSAPTELILIATGSELDLAMQAARLLEQQGRGVKVVSLPCADLFELQPKHYRDSVLPPNISKRLAIEASHKDWWYKYTGLQGRVIGMDRFGESAPADQLFAMFGFTLEKVMATAEDLLAS